MGNNQQTVASKEAFTPGPWEARRSLVHVEGKGTLATVSNPWNDEPEREANTRLIAAAPELYALCQEMLDCVEPRIIEAHDGGGLLALGITHSDTDCSVCKARRILAKARGE